MTASPVEATGREVVDREQLVSDLLHAACIRWLERDRMSTVELLGLAISTLALLAPPTEAPAAPEPAKDPW